MEPEELLEVVRTRRSIRKYASDKEVEDKKLELILEAARWAPSSGNLQNWRFVVVRDKDTIKEIARASYNQKWIAQAPLVIVVCSDTDYVASWYGERGRRLYSIQNTAACIQNMLLMAHSLGLGSCWVGAFDDNWIKRIIGVDLDVHAVIPIGYPKESPAPRKRYSIDDLIIKEI